MSSPGFSATYSTEQRPSVPVSQNSVLAGSFGEPEMKKNRMCVSVPLPA